MAGRTLLLPAQQWSVWHEPRPFRWLVWSVCLVVGAWAVFDLRALPSSTSREWFVGASLVALAVVFEEGGTRIARMQWRLSSELKRDMGSVWSVAAAVALSRGLAVLVVGCILGYVFFRQQRPGGQSAHRAMFVGSSVVAGIMAGNYTFAAISSTNAGPWNLAAAIAAFAAIGVLAIINRGLVTLGLIALGVRARDLLGSSEDNLTEISTLCLGGFVAVAALYAPWLCALAVVPMAVLQRGSFVRELETAAITDSKTALLNAIGWEQVAHRELARARREGYPVSVLIIDIDHFKRVNDRHGHLVGDQVLKGLAAAFHAALREYDILGRFGGEEFVAFLPETGDLSASEIAERVRSRINSVTIGSVSETDDPDLLSVSIGISSTAVEDLPGADLSGMLVGADRALYRAKEAGRNRAFLADSDEAPTAASTDGAELEHVPSDGPVGPDGDR